MGVKNINREVSIGNQIDNIGNLINSSSNNGITNDIKTEEYDLSNLLEELGDEVEDFGENFGNFFNSGTTNTIEYEEVKKDGYTVQGYTIIEYNGEKKIIISAHGDEEKGENARLYVYDEATGEYEGKIILDNCDHVGGITIDAENGILFVASSNGKVNTYNYALLLENLRDAKEDPDGPTFDMSDDNISGNLEEEGIKIPNNIDIFDVLNEGNPKERQEGMDTLYYYNNKLYSSTYSGDGELIVSDIVFENGEIKCSESRELGKLNGAVQGMCFYEEDGKTYMVTASSSARIGPLFAKSRLTKWEMTDEGPVPVGYIYNDHPGLEGIEITEDGTITGVFEDSTQESEILGDIDDFTEKKNPVIDRYLVISGMIWNLANNPDKDKNTQAA